MLFPLERGIEGKTRGLSKPCSSTYQIVLLFHGNYFPLRLFVSAYSRLFFSLCQYVECAYDREIRDRLHCIYQQKAFIIS